MPEISVIIPAYNHADTLPACLDSVFAQTIRHREAEGRGDPVDVLEVIVINDGSTDNTKEVLKPYLDRIIYRETPNSGAQKTRNLGFSLSRGKFVIFCDADVIMKPTMLGKMRTALLTHPQATYAYCGFLFGLAHFRPQEFNADQLRYRNFIHTTALIRRGSFIGFDEKLKRFHDWDMWLSMLEQGKTGVVVRETLFRAIPRKDGMKYAISEWLPKFFYSPFFEALGIRLKSVIRYKHAADIIAKKHGLDLNASIDGGGRLWLGFIAIFAVSAISFGHPWLGTVASLVFLALTVAASLNQLIYGAVAVLAELVFGSLAGKTLMLSLFGFVLPLRMALFAAVLLIWLIRLAQGRARRPHVSIAIGVLITLSAVGWGMVNGLLHNIPFRDVFLDANAYLALPLVLIFISAVKNEQDQILLKKILKHGAIALAILTFAALYFFSHKFWDPAGVFAYKWLRDSRIAEITALDGGLYRVFIQSQIFCVMAFAMVVFGTMRSKLKQYAWAILPAAALVISGSRSFALGLIAAGVAWLIILLSSRAERGISTPRIKPGDSSPWTNRPYGLGMTAWKAAIVAISGVAIFLVALYFPFPASRSQTSFQEMLRSRSVSERDAATVSRWALLKELNAKIVEAPILGSGFGATVTYQSSDPRIVSTTGGAYTTAAFEWNYHDILIKMGLFGLLAYGYLLFAIFAVLNKSEPRTRLWLLPAFFALLATNAVSPYLNHPLGIGYLALLLALAETKKGGAFTVAELVRSKAPVPAAAAVPGLAMVNEE